MESLNRMNESNESINLESIKIITVRTVQYCTRKNRNGKSRMNHESLSHDIKHFNFQLSTPRHSTLDDERGCWEGRYKYNFRIE